MVRTVKKPGERRKEIVNAARELFQEKNYENTTMTDVMGKIGIAKGTIYHYFDSKEALLEAVVETIVAEDIAAKKALLDRTSGNALEKFRVLVTADSVADSHDDILDHLHKPGNMEMHTRLLAVALTRLAPLYAEIIEQGCAEGVFQTEHPLECAEYILSGAQFLTDVGIYPWPMEDLTRRGNAFPYLIEAQLNAPKGSFDFLKEELG